MEPERIRIRLGEETVVKSGPADLLRVEVEKTRRACDIAERCRMFRVPRVLDFDPAKGEAVFERISGLRGIGAYLGEKGRALELVAALAAALATVHRELVLPEELVVPLPTDYRQANNEAFIHGDVSLDNVCVQDGSPSLVILDWQTTPLLGGWATFGTRYFDLAWFVHNLFCRPTWRVLFGDPVAPLAKKFISAYASLAGESFQAGEFFAYLRRFFALELPRVHAYTSRRTRLLLPRGIHLLNKFLADG